MFTHCVLFWLKDGMTDAQQADFATALRPLTTIPTVVNGTVGTPAATNRPVVDRSYTWGLMVTFEDAGGHDVYQTHPTHLAFLEAWKAQFAKVVVYDFEG
jgi:hypothetical protein